jgi:CBS domain-containing protein
MAGVQSELGSATTNPQAAAMLAWVEKLREKTALPDLTTVMDSRTQPATVGPKTTVREAAKLMKERRTTAVCIMESATAPGVLGTQPRIAGIFTSKDVVLRVIAAGLDAGRCSVVRVMTPHPDTAPPTMTVHDALKKMHNGHYLNLPVIEEDGRLVAIVDVLKLTYATLEQVSQSRPDSSSALNLTRTEMNTMAAENAAGGDDQGGPMWGRFFDSIGHDEDGSVVSGSFAGTGSQFAIGSPSGLQPMRSPGSEVHPNDSASVVDDDNVSSISYSRKRGVQMPTGAAPVPVDDGTYVFKFRTPSGRTHRFQSRHDDIEHLREIIAGKLAIDPFFTDLKSDEGQEHPDPNDFLLTYTDADGDTVLMTSDDDVTDAVKIARASKSDRVVLFVQGGKGWAEAGAGKSEAKAHEAAIAAQEQIKEVEKAEAEAAAPAPIINPAEFPTPREAATPVPLHHHQQGPEEIMGIPKDLLLPASIGVLAAVIIGVFTISRLTSSSHY